MLKRRAKLNKWDHRYLQMAELVAGWSKDPSTQTGAVLVKDNRVVSVGYNGFADGVLDDNRLYSRSVKYEMIVHCEVNAVLSAGHDARGATLYTHPFMSCSRCAAVMIQAGIRRVVSHSCDNDRWRQSLVLAQKQFEESDVEVILYDKD